MMYCFFTNGTQMCQSIVILCFLINNDHIEFILYKYDVLYDRLHIHYKTHQKKEVLVSYSHFSIFIPFFLDNFLFFFLIFVLLFRNEISISLLYAQL